MGRPEPRRPAHFPADRPQVVAHRGSSHSNAEHTLGAYLAAIDEGAEALECDVRLSADGHLVCVHDRDLRRTAARRDVVSTMRLEDLENLDVATWKRPWVDLDDEAPDLDVELGRLLTLRRLLEAVADHDRRIDVAIETKHPTRFAGLVERRLVEMLREFGWAGRDSPARVMSFSWVALNRVRRQAPDLDLVLLMERRQNWKFGETLTDEDWIAGPGIALLRRHPKVGRQLRMAGRRLHVWTVNTVEDLELCLDLGVEAVISDRPAEMIRHFSGRAT